MKTIKLTKLNYYNLLNYPGSVTISSSTTSPVNPTSPTKTVIHIPVDAISYMEENVNNAFISVDGEKIAVEESVEEIKKQIHELEFNDQFKEKVLA